jgi:diguanylate cyclase (GGDEF)-like protein
VRYAGDEFTVFLRADLLAGIEVAERIRSTVSAADLGPIAAGLRVSVSTGAAELTPGMTGADLFHVADQCLYRAKRHGRDRVAG